MTKRQARFRGAGFHNHDYTSLHLATRLYSIIIPLKAKPVGLDRLSVTIHAPICLCIPWLLVSIIVASIVPPLRMMMLRLPKLFWTTIERSTGTVSKYLGRRAGECMHARGSYGWVWGRACEENGVNEVEDCEHGCEYEERHGEKNEPYDNSVHGGDAD